MKCWHQLLLRDWMACDCRLVPVDDSRYCNYVSGDFIRRFSVIALCVLCFLGAGKACASTLGESGDNGSLVLLGKQLQSRVKVYGHGARLQMMQAKGENARTAVAASFVQRGGGFSSYQVQVTVPEPYASHSNDYVLRVSLRLTGWDELEYLGYGWRYPDGVYKYVANGHPPYGVWFTDHVDPGGYAVEIRGYRLRPGKRGKIGIYVKGRPCANGADIAISRVELVPVKPPRLVVGGRTYLLDKKCDASPSTKCLSTKEATRIVRTHNPQAIRALREFYSGHGAGAKQYVTSGSIKLHGLPVISGDWWGKVPPNQGLFHITSICLACPYAATVIAGQIRKIWR